MTPERGGLGLLSAAAGAGRGPDGRGRRGHGEAGELGLGLHRRGMNIPGLSLAFGWKKNTKKDLVYIEFVARCKFGQV